MWEEKRSESLCQHLFSPRGHRTCESRTCGARNSKLRLSNRSAEPNYTHWNLQSDAAKPLRLPTSAHMTRISSKPRICLKALKTIWKNRSVTPSQHYWTKQVLCEKNNSALWKSVSAAVRSIQSFRLLRCIDQSLFLLNTRGKEKPHEELRFTEYSTPLHGTNQ